MSGPLASERHVLVAMNPHAGARSRAALVQELAEALRAAGHEVRVVTEIEQLSVEAEQLRRAGRLAAVVAAGGDGTVGLVASRTAPDVPIAILPLGTENLLAKHLGASADPARVCAAIRRGTTIRLDAGTAQGRLFLLMVGCGFDAEVVRRLHSARRGHICHWTYAKPILDSIRNYDYPELRVYCESDSPKGAGGPHSPDSGNPQRTCIAARWVFVVNVPRYAVGLRIAPDAVGDDGLLDVCCFRRGSLWNGLRYLACVVMGRHVTSPDFSRLRVTRLTVESDVPVPFQLDGDPGGYLPVDIEVLPGRLTMIVP